MFSNVDAMWRALRMAGVTGFSVHLRCTGCAYSCTVSVRGSTVALGIGDSLDSAAQDAWGDVREWLDGRTVSAA